MPKLLGRRIYESVLPGPSGYFPHSIVSQGPKPTDRNTNFATRKKNIRERYHDFNEQLA
jgi:hypothetical protein